MGGVSGKLTQEQIDKCNNDAKYRADTSNNCCTAVHNNKDRKKCSSSNLNTIGWERFYDQVTSLENELVDEEKNKITESFITEEAADREITKKNKFLTKYSAIQAKGAALAAKKLATKTKNIKNKAKNIKNETSDLRNETSDLRNETSDLRNETSDLRNYTKHIKAETSNIKDETNNLKDQTNYLKDEAENSVTTINQRVDDTDDLVDNTKEILHHGVGELIGAENISNKQMDFNQNLSAYTEELIDSGIASLESFIGSKKEGFSRDEIYDLLGFLKTKEQTESSALQQSINERLEQSTYDRTSELLLQKDNILTKLISDYMINGETGTNVEKVYEDLKQKNNDELREIQIKSYYNKAYKEYIFILKVVICLIVLLIPIIFLNKYEYIDNNKTLMSVVFIITVGVLFISYRLYLLYLKDDIDYDRIRIPYDRQASELIKQGKMESKGSVFKNIGVTCIGDECCDDSMVYDNLNNKCILSENFGGYFESMQNKNKEEINVIEPYKLENFTTIENLTSIENFTTIENLSHIKERLLRDSLVKSSNTKF